MNSLEEYCQFVEDYLHSRPGDMIHVPFGVSRAELESVVKSRQLWEKEQKAERYADWMANG